MDLSVLKDMLPFLVPVFLLELGLLVFALVDVIRRKEVRGGSKIPWILLIVFVQVIGPIAYLAFGRKEGVVDSD